MQRRTTSCQSLRYPPRSPAAALVARYRAWLGVDGAADPHPAPEPPRPRKVDPDDPDTDPIIEASERNEDGDREGARELLTNLLAEDLRCLDAHAHLGSHLFDHWPEGALWHYELGVAIGTSSLGDGVEGVLPWRLMDNRPSLRCLHGLALCAWRLGDQRRAVATLERLLWLDPSDEQGARFELAAVTSGESWQELQGER